MNIQPNSKELLNNLQKWVSAEALRIDNIEKYDLKIYGTDDQIKQYISDIAFVDISAESFNGEKRDYNLVIKYGQMTEDVTKKLLIRDAFEREIHIYKKLIPSYQRFQQENDLPIFNSVPKCYLTKLTDTEEVIILENLKQSGYDIYDRKIPMDVSHIKLVLEEYAEWHALSFLLENHQEKDFLDIKKCFEKQTWNHFNTNLRGQMFDLSLQHLYDILERNGDIQLLQKYKDKIGDVCARKVLRDLLSRHEPHSVVLHGDCWNNNFMFKYKADESSDRRCIKAALLDFQMSSIGSPVFDLSYFIYSVSSEKELKHFKELIDHYYYHFSRYLKKTGKNPEDIFSYSDLTLHWQKYATYGAIFNPLTVYFSLIDKENIPNFKKKNSSEILPLILEKEEYKRRVVAVAKHFVEYTF